MRCRGFPWFYPRASKTLVLMWLRQAVVFHDATFSSKAPVSRGQDTGAAVLMIADIVPETVYASRESMRSFTTAIIAKCMKS